MINKINGLYSLILLVLLFSCDNEPYEGDFIPENNSCELAIQATESAFESYNLATEDNFNLLCQTYKNALENQIEICGDQNGTLQVIVDGLSNCTNNFGLCDEAIAAALLAQNSYIAATDDNFEILCNAYKNALQNQIVVCGDDGTLQSLIEELDNCEIIFVETEGTWKLVSWVTDLLRDIDNDGVVTNQYLDEIDCYNNETITFNSDGTGTFFLRSTANITYTPVEGSATDIDFSVTCFDISEDRLFTWVQNGNTISITMMDGTVVNHFRNGNSLFVAYDDGFFATSTIVGGADISERITHVYLKL